MKKKATRKKAFVPRKVTKKKAPVRKAAPRKRGPTLSTKLALLESAYQILLHDFQKVENQVGNLMDALGGAIWKTASGHKIPVRLMSDTHLQSILDGKFGSWVLRELVISEQQRRNEDDAWAARQGPGSPRVRLSKLEEHIHNLRGYMPPPPLEETRLPGIAPTPKRRDFEMSGTYENSTEGRQGLIRDIAASMGLKVSFD